MYADRGVKSGFLQFLLQKRGALLKKKCKPPPIPVQFFPSQVGGEPKYKFFLYQSKLGLLATTTLPLFPYALLLFCYILSTV